MNCYGITVDNTLGQIYYSGWTPTKSAWIKVATFDGLLRKTVLSSTDNPSIRKPRDIVFNNGYEKDIICYL
jgi:hypothetical protein